VLALPGGRVIEAMPDDGGTKNTSVFVEAITHTRDPLYLQISAFDSAIVDSHRTSVAPHN
jgi:hypothetical protein